MNDRIARQRRVVAEHIRGENDKDWETVYGTFVQDDRAHFDVVPMETVFRGIEGVRGIYQTFSVAFPDFQIEVRSEHVVPGASILEVIITGTHQGEFAGVKPLGNPVRIPLAAFYTFDDTSEKLISERIYFDHATLVAQMQAGG